MKSSRIIYCLFVAFLISGIPVSNIQAQTECEIDMYIVEDTKTLSAK